MIRKVLYTEKIKDLIDAHNQNADQIIQELVLASKSISFNANDVNYTITLGDGLEIIDDELVVTSTGGGDISSVNGQTGDVVLTAADVGADPAGSAAQALIDANNYTDNIGAVDIATGTWDGDSTNVRDALNEILTIAMSGTGGTGGMVLSVNGQTGEVVLNATDVGADPAGSAASALFTATNYTNAQIASITAESISTGTWNGSSTNVKAALNEVYDIAISGTSGTGGGSTYNFTNGLLEDSGTVGLGGTINETVQFDVGSSSLIRFRFEANPAFLGENTLNAAGRTDIYTVFNTPNNRVSYFLQNTNIFLFFVRNFDNIESRISLRDDGSVSLESSNLDTSTTIGMTVNQDGIVFDGLPTSDSGLPDYAIWCDTANGNVIKQKRP
jgi:hypothetical protein